MTDMSTTKDRSILLDVKGLKTYFFQRRGVLKAVDNINSKIFKFIKNQNSYNQKKIDDILIKLDGTKNKSNLGANAILAVSIANCKASAKSKKKKFMNIYLKLKSIYFLIQ